MYLKINYLLKPKLRRLEVIILYKNVYKTRLWDNKSYSKLFYCKKQYDFIKICLEKFNKI